MKLDELKDKRILILGFGKVGSKKLSSKAKKLYPPTFSRSGKSWD
jgi:hypothetical protein